MIWLRHELWEYNDGLGYRLASRTDGDETGSGHRGGVLKHVFYAPSPAAAKAQYWALRQLGPIIPSRFESDEPFTLGQLQAQLVQFPDDATLHAQPVLHPEQDADTPLPAALAVSSVTADVEPLESLEPWPVVAHSEPDLAEAPVTPPEAPLETAVAQAEADLAEAADEEPELPSNVVPIRPAATAPRPEPTEEPQSEPQSAEAVAMERPPIVASGALALALAELGPAAAASGALALALAELEPTPHSRPDDGDTGAGAGGGAPLALVASHSTSTLDDAPATTSTVGEAEVAEVVTAAHATDTASAEPVAVEAVAASAEVAPQAAEPEVIEPQAVEPLAPEPVAASAEVAEPLVPEPIAAEKAVEPDPLGPITAVAAAGSRGKRKGTGFFGALLRLLILAIVAGAIIIGVGIATGRLDGPTLLAQARALPDQARQLPSTAPAFIRDLLPR